MNRRRAKKNIIPVSGSTIIIGAAIWIKGIADRWFVKTSLFRSMVAMRLFAKDLL